jgi:hypothetical protein
MITSDELLAKIKSLADAWAEPSYNANALRAVVQLHYPQWMEANEYSSWFCPVCKEVEYFNGMADIQTLNWPCPTIEAILKELA